MRSVDRRSDSATIRIDMHSHILPPPFLVEADKRGGVGWSGRLPQLADCVAWMQAYDIDATVLSLPAALDFGGDLEPARVRALARSCNEFYAELIREAPGNIGALAVLPLPDINASLDELTYSIDELGLDGVILLARYGTGLLGDSAYDALFDELQRRRAYAFVHPVGGAELFKFLLELPFETTRAVMNLLFSGTLARCPDIRLQFAHMGGAAPYLAPRVVEALARFPDAAEAAPEGLGHLRRLYWDTSLSAGPGPIRAALELTDIDHIVFGTDWPFNIARPKHGPDPAPGLAFLGAARARIDCDNPLALVPRLTELAAR